MLRNLWVFNALTELRKLKRTTVYLQYQHEVGDVQSVTHDFSGIQKYLV